MTRPEPVPFEVPAERDEPARFGCEVEALLAEHRRVAANLAVAEAVRAGRWPVVAPLRTGALNAV